MTSTRLPFYTANFRYRAGKSCTPEPETLLFEAKVFTRAICQGLPPPASGSEVLHCGLPVLLCFLWDAGRDGFGVGSGQALSECI